MRFIDLKVWQKITVVFGIFLIGFIILSVWDYKNISHLDKGFLNRFVIAHASLGLFFLLIFSGFVFLVSKSFRSTLEAAEKLSQGDLSFTIVSNRNDELGQIENSLSILQRKLVQIINHIRETTGNLIAASSELNSGSQLISTGANDQAATSTEISMTMDQIAMISKQSTDSANETSSIAKMAFEGIQKGADDVNKALEVIEEIARKNSIISEISYQTKILSINASVEAARAAEFGRGFNVIAEQVKRLAETSQTSAADIKSVSRKGVQITRDSAEHLRELVGEFHKTSDLIQQVAQAGSEQYIAIDQINLSMQELNNITQQNASSSEELTASSEELMRLSESLSRQISFFKLTKEELEDETDQKMNVEDDNSDSDWRNSSSKEEDYSYLRYEDTESVNESESEFSHLFSERSSQQVEDKDATKRADESEKIEEHSTTSNNPKKKVDQSSRADEQEYEDDVTKQKAPTRGVRINLSDNDDIDRQFEKYK